MNINVIKPVNLLSNAVKNKELKNFFNLQYAEINNEESCYFAINETPYVDLALYKNIIHGIIKLLKLDHKLIKFGKHSDLKKQLMLYINEFKIKQTNLVDNEYKQSLQDIFLEINKMLNHNSYNIFKLFNKILKILSNIGSAFIAVNLMVLIINIIVNKSFSECKKIIVLSAGNDRLNHMMIVSYLSLVLIFCHKIVNNYLKSIPIDIVKKSFKKNDHYFYLNSCDDFFKSLKDDKSNNKAINNIFNNDNVEYDCEFLELFLNFTVIFSTCLELLVICF